MDRFVDKVSKGVVHAPSLAPLPAQEVRCECLDHVQILGVHHFVAEIVKIAWSVLKNWSCDTAEEAIQKSPLIV